ncbi:Crp/Fnr family transcriptional regulator [Nitratireductor rhodophyticola]|uniref:Crp/Fnr family transcriptional regulator n=1 Tax=Nitratireductor rhodophyticola TaxID=2854036 RepID=A0ABS7RA27_9HYPH|nr:Crp/Fnr family transcriptional regulator [Nitratireductor rhodophyticola]MBY8917774.1 Crp/Fnr family transcriptional regulator [Nitratireductor rhodophyticola]MBY8922485.1 Crp/Fnr family transcriptional regulator [Nitratireductor rhodophyticola]MEC9245429.1 Crp/Fnr family transcriptional regulator [Pseudomonadota bacterium]WPZ12573.1 Crp/Fnr family transcriptional regulator [Nitratireductor rhodophyticola]
MTTKRDIAGETIWAAELTDDELERARRGLTERLFSKGSYICHRGDRLDHWTGVVEGLIKISAISAAGKAMTFAGVTDGGWFGEGSVLKNEPRQYDVVAIRDTRLAMLSRSSFLWLYENSTGFNRFLVRQLNERMGQFIATIEYDRILGPTARVARNLSWFFNRTLYPRAGTTIEISQEELGLLAGVSRQVVNRALRALEDEGLLKAEHGRITVVDAGALSHYES